MVEANKMIEITREISLNNEIPVLPMVRGEKAPLIKWKDAVENGTWKNEFENYIDRARREEINLAGYINGKFFVIDIENKELAEKSFQLDKLKDNTIIVKTNRGYHIYFKANDFTPKNIHYGNAFEIRANNCLIMLPPSMHPSGKIYEYVGNQTNIISIRKEDFDKMVEKIKENAIMLNLDISNENDIKGKTEAINVDKKIEQGQRNITLFKIGLKLGSADFNLVHSTLKTINFERCEPPLNDFEVENITKSVVKYNTLKEENKNKELIKDNLIEAFTEILINAYKIKTIENKVFVYSEKDGIYITDMDGKVKSYIENLGRELDMVVKNNFVNEVFEKIKRRTYVSNVEIEQKDINLIPLNNGYYDIDTGEFHEFTPEKIFLNKLNVNYDKTATAERFMAFLNEIMKGNEKKINLILDMMAYTLYRRYQHEKIFCLVGTGANGKSTLLKVLNEILGINNVAHKSLHELQSNRFAIADLFNKYANICGELKSKEMEDFDKIKDLVEDVEITAERKFENSFNFKNYAKLIFATNKLPLITEDTDAVYRRIVLITFDVQIPIDKQDKHLFDKLVVEKSGILNILLQRLPNIIKNGFDYENDIDKIRERYQRLATSEEIFASDFFEFGNTYIAIKDAYECYLDFCKSENLTPASRERLVRTLMKRFKEEGSKVLKKRMRMKNIEGYNYNTLEYVLMHIRLLPPYDRYNRIIVDEDENKRT